MGRRPASPHPIGAGPRIRQRTECEEQRDHGEGGRRGFQDAAADMAARNWFCRRSLAMMLVFVYGFIAFSVYLSFTDSRLCPRTRLGRVGELFEALASAAIGKYRSPIWAFSQASLYRYLHLSRPWPRDPSGSEDPGRRRPSHHLSLPHGAQLHRDRDGLEVVSRSRYRA